MVRGLRSHPALRRSVLVAGAVALMLAPTAAWARGDGWQPVQFSPFDWTCGSTTVHITVPENKEYFRLIEQPDGSVVQQTTGSLTVNFATDAGASVTEKVPGPGSSVTYPDGTFEFRGTGQNVNLLTADQSAEVGLPEIFASSGPVDIIFHTDGSATAVTIPPVVTDVCAALGA